MDVFDLVFTNLRKRDCILSIADSLNLSKDFDKLFNSVDKNVQNYRRNLNYLLELVGSNLSQNILDIGCGFGENIIELANLGHKCIGLEAKQSRVILINKIGKKININVNANPGDACNLPYKCESFDIVMSKNFFEHVYDFEKALDEQIRILKQKGKIIIKDGNLLCPPLLFDLLFSYPRRTRGKRGGVKWLFTKSKVIDNYFEDAFPGKDEDIKTVWWWRRKLSQEARLRILMITTTGFFKNRDRKYARLLKPFYGAILVVAQKT